MRVSMSPWSWKLISNAALVNHVCLFWKWKLSSQIHNEVYLLLLAISTTNTNQFLHTRTHNTFVQQSQTKPTDWALSSLLKFMKSLVGHEYEIRCDIGSSVHFSFIIDCFSTVSHFDHQQPLKIIWGDKMLSWRWYSVYFVIAITGGVLWIYHFIKKACHYNKIKMSE